MGLLKNPPYPFEPNTASPHSQELAKAKALYDQEIDSTAGWEELESKDDVIMEKKTLPGLKEAAGIPLVRGTCVIKNATTDSVVPVLQTPGVRKNWDPRFETAWMLRRFSNNSYTFYSLGNSPPGLGWLIYPRDLVGIHQTYIDGEDRAEGLGGNKEIVLLQTSIVDKQRAPELRSTTRMNLTLSAWRLVPQGNDVKITYLIKVALGGSIPEKMVATVIQDLPICAGKVRDLYTKFGYPPYIVHTSPAGSPRCTPQTESFTFGPTKAGVHEPVRNDKHWHLYMTGVQGSSFDIMYDIQAMYAKEGGVHALVKGPGKDGVSVVDDANGIVTVKVGERAHDKHFEIVLEPHGHSADSARA